MTYQVLLSRKAQKQLSKLPKATYLKLKDKINSLADDPRPPGCKKLQGNDAYRIRHGDYRVIYDIRDALLIIQVVTVDHRKDVYR